MAEQTYKIPAGAQSAAKRALKWISEGQAGSGFTSVGRARAAQLARGGSVSREVVGRMRSYFARHENDRKADGFFANSDKYPSPGRVAWDAWGGDAGRSWVKGISLEEADRPAPKKDQIKGSDKNKPGSASTGSGSITVSPAIKKGLENKVTTHNDEMKSAGKGASTRATYGALAAVYRRGAGAFSSSYRPGQNRNSWAMARVNAFLYLLKNGRPKNSAYVTDNDLLPSAHPKSSK